MFFLQFRPALTSRPCETQLRDVALRFSLAHHVYHLNDGEDGIAWNDVTTSSSRKWESAQGILTRVFFKVWLWRVCVMSVSQLGGGLKHSKFLPLCMGRFPFWLVFFPAFATTNCSELVILFMKVTNFYRDLYWRHETRPRTRCWRHVTCVKRINRLCVPTWIVDFIHV